ncbi:metal-dependent transcriptional regulator [Haloarchaeobius sp. DFWS5]|uniref:metal-dependent transcriptional regulator n=1 Tax=Haloarchaeobius sp. DFWS5 TaxID=3446114 RepID=UPI003EBAEAC4
MVAHDADETADAPDRQSVTPTMEDYLRHIYRLSEEGNGWVTNAQLAERIDVERATVTSMFGALATAGLIDREKYQPVRLTDDGRTLALDVVRRHRLVETFLLDVFGYRISEVDVEADVLEHHVSDRLCREIDDLLGQPETDPHGDPIPDADLQLDEDAGATALTEVAIAASVEVTRVLTQDQRVLDHLVSAGIEPTATLTLDERAPFGMVTVTVDGGGQTSLPEAVASTVLVSEQSGE